MGVEVIATVPAQGGHAEDGVPLVASVRLAPDAPAPELRLALDGEDVTARCAVRTDRAHPPRRADLVLAGPLGAGEHEAEVSWLTPGGAQRTHRWRFAVGGRTGAPRSEEKR